MAVSLFLNVHLGGKAGLRRAGFVPDRLKNSYIAEERVRRLVRKEYY